jgi:hypothetical protein
VPWQPAVDQYEAAGVLQEVEVDLGVAEPGDGAAGRCGAVLGMASSR